MTNNSKITVLQGDITKIEVDAIVNAANNTLLGGGGVDGAIHKVAGPELLKECRKLNGCETGKAKITNAYNLPAEYVIHTVGPFWHGGNQKEEELLADCYKNSLALATKNEVKTIAFPNISTGVYRFPKQLAAMIAYNEVKKILEKNDTIEKVLFVCFDNENFQLYKNMVNE